MNRHRIFLSPDIFKRNLLFFHNLPNPVLFRNSQTKHPQWSNGFVCDLLESSPRILRCTLNSSSFLTLYLDGLTTNGRMCVLDGMHSNFLDKSQMERGTVVWTSHSSSQYVFVCLPFYLLFVTCSHAELKERPITCFEKFFELKKVKAVVEKKVFVEWLIFFLIGKQGSNTVLLCALVWAISCKFFCKRTFWCQS